MSSTISRTSWAFNRPHVLRSDGGPPSFCFARRRKSKNQFGVAKNRYVGIVSGENKLATTFLLAHLGHDPFCDEAIVEVVFRLVNNQRRLRP